MEGMCPQGNNSWRELCWRRGMRQVRPAWTGGCSFKDFERQVMNPREEVCFTSKQKDDSQMHREEDSRRIGCPLFISSGKNLPWKTELKKISVLIIMEDRVQTDAGEQMHAAGSHRNTWVSKGVYHGIKGNFKKCAQLFYLDESRRVSGCWSRQWRIGRRMPLRGGISPESRRRARHQGGTGWGGY